MCNKEKFAFSDNPELFSYTSSSIKDAIKEAKQLGWESVYIGELVPKFFTEYFDLNTVLDNMNERASDELNPDAVDCWPIGQVSILAQAELVEFIHSWADKYDLHPTFFGIEDYEKYDVKTGKICK